MEEIRLPTSCLVVLVGASSSGKSTWADANFAWHQVVSSDRLRAMVGASEADRRAGTDAFALLDDIVGRRLKRGLLTVVDTLGLDRERRRGYVALAERHGIPAHAVVFSTPDEVCRRRNRERRHPLPQKVLTNQLGQARAVLDEIAEDGFAAVHLAASEQPAAAAVVPDTMVAAPEAALRQSEAPVTMRFGLQISDFTWQGGPAAMRDRLTAIARTAEEAGFSSLWVMDHFRQIPQIGPEWHDMPESYTTLSFLAGVTERATLGTLVTGVTYRHPALLGRMIATLDVLSGGRAVCGLGLGWFEKEAAAYGWEMPPRDDRYALLEDTVELLRLLWGPGAPRFEGRLLTVPEAMCYPRPLQDRVPILIGGGGEQRTLRLVARHADMCNLFGDAAAVRHKLAVLRRHCEDEGRDPSAIEVSHLSQVMIAGDRAALAEELARVAGPRHSVEQAAASLGAGTVEDHIGRYRDLAEAGVQHAIVGLHGIDSLEPIRRFGQVIAAFA